MDAGSAENRRWALHLLMSVSRSPVGVVAGALTDAGRLNRAALLSACLTEGADDSRPGPRGPGS